MKRWFLKLKENLEQWFSDCYGCDELSFFLLVVCSVSLLLARFPMWKYVIAVAIFSGGLSLLRCLSHREESRQQELELYLELKLAAFTAIEEWKEKLRFRRQYKKVRCKHCGAVMLVSRGNDPTEIVCPSCGHKIKRWL